MDGAAQLICNTCTDIYPFILGTLKTYDIARHLMLLIFQSALIAGHCIFPERRLQGKASELTVSIDYICYSKP